MTFIKWCKKYYNTNDIVMAEIAESGDSFFISLKLTNTNRLELLCKTKEDAEERLAEIIELMGAKIIQLINK